MNVNEFAVGALENAKWLTTMSVEGLTDEEMLFQPKPGLNNAMWLLAHIVDSGNGLILGFCKGESLLPGDWHARFGIGSRPSSNPADYQSRDEVLASVGRPVQRTA